MRRIAVAVVAAGAVAAVVMTLVAGRGAAGAGPLAWPSSSGSAGVGLGVHPGQVFAATIPLPRTLSNPTELVAVRPLHPEDARDVSLQYGATTGRGLSVGGARGWHPAAWQMHPLAGFVIPAHVRGGVTIGVSSTERGVHWIRGFVLDYKIGGTTYSAPQQFAMKLCVGKSLSCPSDS